MNTCLRCGAKIDSTTFGLRHGVVKFMCRKCRFEWFIDTKNGFRMTWLCLDRENEQSPWYRPVPLGTLFVEPVGEIVE